MTESAKTEVSAESDEAVDPRPVFQQAANQLADLIVEVRPEHLDAPTPCAAWTVRDLLGHLVGVTRGLAQLGSAGSVTAEQLASGADVRDNGWPAAFAEARADVSIVWADDAKLDEPYQLPFGELTGRKALLLPVLEAVAHAWDLARALGDEERVLDAELAEFTLSFVDAFAPEGSRSTGGGPFGPVLSAPTDAGPYERLAAQLGRRPDWAPPAA